jgi:hypothetical protein
MSWKDKFAASKLWNHKIAEKIFSICGQKGLQIAHRLRIHRKMNSGGSPIMFFGLIRLEILRFGPE